MGKTAKLARTGAAVKTISATEIKNRLGQYLSRVAVEPVAIEKNGHVVAVLLSAEEYEQLQVADDELWARAARAAADEGLLGAEESLRRLLDKPAAEGLAAS
jgi:prevent-host-death family protein